MDIVKKIREKARGNIKTIVLPETKDKRVLEAAKIIEKEKIARIVLLDKSKFNSSDQEKFSQQFYELRKAKGLSLDEARRILNNPLYYAGMMVRNDIADAFVAGAANTTPDVVRAAIYCLGVDKDSSLASSCFIMAVPDCKYGLDGTFIFADCAVIPEPNSRQLAQIAISSAELAKKVLGFEPKIALLSYSTRGKSNSKQVEEVREALKQAKELRPDLVIDGEIQADAAIVPEVSQIKYPDGLLKGEANILVFPDLESGNISYKLVQRLAKARAIGPLIIGLNKSCSDLSRGCNVEDIVDCVAVTAIRAQ